MKAHLIRPSRVRLLTRRYGLSMRLVLASLAGSMIVALLVSTVQIYVLYQQGAAGAQQRLHEIESSYLPSLESALWEVNAATTDRLMNGMARLPDVGAVALTDELGNTVRQSSGAGGDKIGARRFALAYHEGSASYALGSLEVELSDSALVAALKQRALGITITVFLSVLCGAALFLLLFQRWVARHLRDMAAFVRDADLRTGPAELRLQRAANSMPDELDYVVTAINAMRATLRKDLLTLTASAEEIRRHRDSLEALVQQRTEMLSAQNGALLSVRDQLTTAAQVASLGIWSWAIASDTLQWNTRNYEIFDLAEAEADGSLDYLRWSARVHADDLPAVRVAFARARDEGLAFDVVFRVIGLQGDIRHVHSAAHVERDAAGVALRVIGICRDISGQQELETRLRTAKEQAELASRTKSEFVANMSHEIRTPLNAVLGIARLLSNSSLSAAQQESVDMIVASGQSLLRILNDILDFSKVEAGRMDLSARSFDLDEVIAPVAAIMVASVGERALDLAIGIDPAVPPLLLGDPLRLQQVLVNLVGNAIKFTRQGQVALLVEVAQQRGDTVLLDFVVSDTGIGIDSAQQARLFAPFGQADASITRQFGGTGLGLAISRKIAELMGGTISMRSTPGQGSEFRVQLPFAVGAGTRAGGAASMRGLRLLIVDQDATRRDYLARTVRAWGGQADCVASFAHARTWRAHQSADAKPFDAVLAAYDAYATDTDAIATPAAIASPASSDAAATTRASAPAQRPMVDLPLLLLCRSGQAASAGVLSAIGADARVAVLSQPLLGPKLAATLHGLREPVRMAANLAAPAAAGTDIGGLEGIHLLLVEDNDINQFVARGMLEMAGATVDIVGDGQQAVERLRSHAHLYQLVLMDIQMPVMDGLTATAILRKELGLTMPVIAMTAGVLESEQQQCEDAGMNSVIAKPVDLDIMRATILRQLQRVPG